MFRTDNLHLAQLFDISLINRYFMTNYTPEDLDDWQDWEVSDILAYVHSMIGTDDDTE